MEVKSLFLEGDDVTGEEPEAESEEEEEGGEEEEKENW